MADRYEQLLRRSETSIEYWAEQPILEFIDSLCRLMEQHKIKRSELADALGTSRPYVTKLLSGRVNFTVATMVKVALAVGGALHTHVADKDAIVHWIEGFPGERPKIVRLDTTAPNGKTIENYTAEADAAGTTVDAGVSFGRGDLARVAANG
jgi:transcriptional regulator with XRE-family HTH domain